MEGASMDTTQHERHLAEVSDQGFTIVPNVFSSQRAEAFARRIREIEHETLKPLQPNEKEEDSSFLRTAGLLRLDRMFWDVPIDPIISSLVEGILGPNFLLSTFTGIDLKPRSGTVQPLHPDDALVPVPRPHAQPIGCTVMWVVTPFSKSTGGTRLLPGSHREPLDLLFDQNDARLAATIQPELVPGTALVFDHALFHGAADNPSDDWRLGMQVSYHAGWVRPYTNWFRTIPIEEVREFPEALRDQLGYQTFHGIGTAHMTPGSYRESYVNREAREPRISLE